MDSLTNVYLHVVWLFNSVKLISLQAQYYTGQIMRMCMLKLNLLFEYDDKFSNGRAQIRKYWCGICITENTSLSFVYAAL